MLSRFTQKPSAPPSPGDAASSATAVDVASDKSWWSSMMDNQLFGAGVGVAGLGVGVAIMRRAVMSGILFAQRNLTTSLEIPSKDRSYPWVLQWINKVTKGRTQHLGVETRLSMQGNGSHTTSFEFVPSPGRHFFWYKRHLIQVQREREKSMVDINNGTPWETLTLTVVGRKTDIFSQLLSDAKTEALSREDGKTVIYSPMMTDWRPFGQPRRRRPLQSVILDAGIAEKLEADLKEFHASGKWYVDLGTFRSARTHTDA